MRFLNDPSEYLLNRKVVSEIIVPNALFPDRVFTDRFGHFQFVTFDQILMRPFFLNIKDFLQAIDEDTFQFSVIDPDPEEYYYGNFFKYSVVTFSSTDTGEDYIVALNADPGRSPADAIMHNSNSVLIYSFSCRWAVYGERDLGIGVCAFSDMSVSNIFTEVYGVDLLPGIDDAIRLMKLAFNNGKVPIDIEQKFRTSYSP